MNKIFIYFIQAIEFLIKKKIRAKEFVLLGFSTTPNKLFRHIARFYGARVIKGSGETCQWSFFVRTNNEYLNPKEYLKPDNHGENYFFIKFPENA